MKIKTKYLDEVEIDKEKIIKFEKGLPGFEDSKEFALLEIEDLIGFKFLQDINNEYLCFTLVNPFKFLDSYEFNIPDEKLKRLDLNLNDDLLVYNIVTLSNSLEESTVNLLAPIIINLSNMKGEQFILNNDEYKTKHKLFLKGDKDACTK